MHSYDYPRPAVTVDLAAFSIRDNALCVLLIKRNTAPFKGKWTLPGGFVHDSEPLELSAARVLNDKANISDVYTEQLYTFGSPRRDPRDRVISIAYFAILNPAYEYVGPGKWYDIEELPKLGFDHNDIVQMAVNRLRAKLNYSELALEFMPEEFTLGNLQNAWECIVATPVDKRNFRKTMLKRDMLVETGKKSTGGAHPPAKLYKRR